MQDKKAELGIGLLVILIASLIVCAVAAGIILSTTNSLESATHNNFQQAKGKISTHFIILNIEGTNGRNGYLNNFTIHGKLAPGSEGIDLRKCAMVINTRTAQAMLKFRENGTYDLGNKGFNTWIDQEMDQVIVGNTYILNEDLDDDTNNDTLSITTTDLSITLSNAGVWTTSLGVDISNPNQAIDVEQDIVLGGTTYGHVSLHGLSGAANIIPADVPFNVKPGEYGHGYFTATTRVNATNHFPNFIIPGDMTELFFESPGPVHEYEQLMISFIPNKGIETTVPLYFATGFEGTTIQVFP